MKLVIVESPTKAKTISKFLGDDFVVKSSFGHIRDLPKDDLGIDVENDFKPKYIIPTKARKNVTALKKDSEKADTVILATDEDREGEAIAWHLMQALKLGTTNKKHLTKNRPEMNGPGSTVIGHRSSVQKVQRIVFHEITKSAIDSALEHPRTVDQNLVDAQQARRILDRLVGYKLSPILWKRYFRGLSAGRVQSVATRLIVEREREIGKFIPEEYWSVAALLESKNATQTPIEASLAKIGGQQLDKLFIKNKGQADDVLANLAGASWTVLDVQRTQVIRSPHAPFTTSTLQQEGAKKLRYSSKQTMTLAQQLYEAGFITYMRTDSVNLSEESVAKAKDFISKNYGTNYHHARRFKTKTKAAQEAHEAVRPTEPDKTPDRLKSELTPQQWRLYDLIWRRFTASQMSPAIMDAASIDVEAKSLKQEVQSYVFRANGTTMKFDGYLKVYPVKFEEKNLPVVNAGEVLDLKELKPEQHFTKPPARFNEASLIKTLEKEGIGRPSTYAAIISTILARKYVEKDRSRYFHATETGMLVNDFLVEHFPNIVDIRFTSLMEDQLDGIAAGTTQWVPLIRGFYEPFAVQLEEKMKDAKIQKSAETEVTDKICDKCGSPMVVKRGRFGKFIACSNFPKCKNILKEKKDAAPAEPTGEKCDKCGSDMVYRTGRFGKFIACSNFPKCKNTKKIAKDAAPAPESESPQG